jgi:NAD(P)-dependent dehydrogenase (short-subunit alcohol dehydrogenase family)
MASGPGERLQGTALVTGGAVRLGRAIALALAGLGMDVVVHVRSSLSEGQQTVEAIRLLGRRAFLVSADLGDEQQARDLVPRAVQAAGPLLVLVNSASVFPADSLLEFSGDALARNVAVNAMAPLALSRAFAAQGHGGVIVNLLDSRITDYDRLHASYHLSKKMLYDITRMLALELAPAVRVNGVAPGLVLPPAGEDASWLEANRKTNPLRSYGSPEEVADAVCFLVRSRFITGQVLFVDGGRHLRGSVY